MLQENECYWTWKPDGLVLRAGNVLRKQTDSVFGTCAVKDRREARWAFSL